MKPLHTAIILNGPPGVGKDTLALLLEQYGLTKMEFKKSLYVAAAEDFEVGLSEFTRRATDSILKEEPWNELKHPVTGDILSPRQALIYSSEVVRKPKYGKSHFGDLAAANCIAENAILAAFSDGGFQEEIPPIAGVYRNVVIFRLHRDGFTFEGDSRNYLQEFPNTFDLHLVDGDPMTTIHQILFIAEPYLDAA